MAIQSESISDQMDDVRNFAAPTASAEWERCEYALGLCWISR